ncbi:MAG: hypothetical protein FJ306_12115, partial [Planctomycetes bacterium]|nr:hypothetical protein [Planctomycetota bacterium]
GAWLADFQTASKDGRPAWRNALAAMAAQSDGAVAVDDVPAVPAAERAPSAPPQALAPLRRPGRDVDAREQTSFTRLMAQRDADVADRDVVDDEPQPETIATEPDVPATGMFAFARGAAAGICLHELLERVDLRAADGPAARAAVQQALADHGLLAPTAHRGAIDPVADTAAMLRALADAVVTPPGCTLAELTGGDKRAEWEFLLPIAAEPIGLASALARSSSAIVREQGKRLLAMRRTRLNGFLSGSADLVCEHDGRYWILDWKSNHLGNRREDYLGPQLRAAMLASDYVLQYCLYTLALHRQLRAQLPDYEPARHLGGVCYVFVRGVAAGSDSGLFTEAIDPQLAHALDAWTATAGKEAGA